MSQRLLQRDCRLRSLPSDSFRNTKLENLDLSYNEFQVRYLDLQIINEET